MIIKPSVYEERTRKARQAHTCTECCRPIVVGGTYRHVKGLWEGTWSRYKLCEYCTSLWDKLTELTTYDDEYPIYTRVLECAFIAELITEDEFDEHRKRIRAHNERKRRKL